MLSGATGMAGHGLTDFGADWCHRALALQDAAYAAHRVQGQGVERGRSDLPRAQGCGHLRLQLATSRRLRCVCPRVSAACSRLAAEQLLNFNIKQYQKLIPELALVEKPQWRDQASTCAGLLQRLNAVPFLVAQCRTGKTEAGPWYNMVT